MPTDLIAAAAREGAAASALEALARDTDLSAAGREMYALVERMFPFPRSITGDGVRQTLEAVREVAPTLEVHEVPTGVPVFDWTVPEEWNVREAWIKDPQGRTVVDLRRSSLHVLGYSVPVHRRMPLAELQQHLYSLPDRPDLTPYRTAYYTSTWGFCLPHAAREALEEGEYEVKIDAARGPGALTYGECFVEGEEPQEVLLSCHVCHPALANDNLSGISLCAWLAGQLARRRPRYSYRFLFVPGTIGSITWLAHNEHRLDRIAHGLVVVNVGDRGQPTYKRSRRGDADVDRAVTHVLRRRGEEHDVREFEPWGYDERQYCSPAFDLPVGSLTRTPHNEYPEYHTSGDDLQLVRPEQLGHSLGLYLEVLSVLEQNRRYLNLNPCCEPQLGRRGLFDAIGGKHEREIDPLDMLWVLNQSDGRHDLLAVAERSGRDFTRLAAAAALLEQHGLLQVQEEV